MSTYEHMIPICLVFLNTEPTFIEKFANFSAEVVSDPLPLFQNDVLPSGFYVQSLRLFF